MEYSWKGYKFFKTFSGNSQVIKNTFKDISCFKCFKFLAGKKKYFSKSHTPTP